MKYIKSPLISYENIDNGYEVVNLISGKTFFINNNIKYIIDFFDTPKSRIELVEYLSDKNILPNQLNNTLIFLEENKLIYNECNISTLSNDLLLSNNSIWGVENNKTSNLKKLDIAFIGIPFGLGNHYDINTQKFPEALRKNSVKIKNYDKRDNSSINYSAFNNFTDVKKILCKIKKNLIFDLGNIFYIPGEPNYFVYRKIYYNLKKIFEKEAIPFSIGGDHSITYPIVKALSEKYTKFNIIQFDAHSDFVSTPLLELRDKNNEYAFLNHATVMNYCDRENAVQNIFQLGTREYLVNNTEKIKRFSLYQLRNNFDSIDNIIPKDIPVYITFDIDFFDPSVAPGTATKIINGAMIDETMEWIFRLIKNRKIVGVDIVESNTDIDENGFTLQLVQNLLFHLVSLL